VKALAIAADSWAAGDLTRRAAVKGEDEIGRLGAHFNIMSERLASTDRARRAFVANVSHDLRTPVAIMRGHLERLQSLQANVPAEAAPLAAGVGASERGGAPPAGDTLIGERLLPGETVSVDPATIDLLHRETVTLGRLIDDLFTLARVEETQLPLELGPLNLAEPVTEAVEGLRQLAWTQSKVTVQSLIRPDLPLVMGDATRIRQILNNLIYNALRHTPAGGLVIVDAQEVAGNTQVEVSVMDTGVGIPPEKLPSVFERFVHGDDSVRGKGEGSGLGLHIVKQLVEAQSGTITVESSLGQGTVFRFRLPRAVKASGRGAEKGRY
jgi:signal transduction histidine kinase